MRVTFRGRERVLKYIGSASWCDYSTGQDAVDGTTDSAADNPYLFVFADAYSQLTDPIRLNKSGISITGESPGRTSLVGPTTWSTSTTENNSVIQIEPVADGTPVTDVGVYDLRIRKEVASTAAQNNAPITVGRVRLRTPGAGTQWKHYAAFQPFDRVEIAGCWLEGELEAINIRGQSNATPLEDPGSIRLIGNRFSSARIGGTIGGNMRLLSQGNLYDVDTVRPDMDPGDYRVMGLMIDSSWPSRLDESPHTWLEDVAHVESQYVSVRDTFRVTGGDGIMEAVDDSAKQYYTGVGVYAVNFEGYPEPDSVGDATPPLRMIRPTIDVTYDHPYTPLRGVTGVSQVFVPTTGENFGTGTNVTFEIHGGSIRVRNLSTSASAPQNVQGVKIQGGVTAGANSNQVDVVGCRIEVENNTPGGNAYSLETNNTQDTIRHHVVTAQAKNVVAGTMTQLGLLA